MTNVNKKFIEKINIKNLNKLFDGSNRFRCNEKYKLNIING